MSYVYESEVRTQKLIAKTRFYVRQVMDNTNLTPAVVDSTKRLTEIDILRILSVTIVVLLLHIPLSYSYNFYVEFDAITEFLLLKMGGYASLGAFVFLSGFCLYLNKANRNIDSTEKVSNFMKKRVLRIFPLYWIALAIFIILFEPSMNIILLLAHIIGIQSIAAPTFGTPIITLWFIGIIVVYYMIFIILSYMGSIKKIISTAIFIFIGLLVLHFQFNIVEFQLIQYYPSFILGIITAEFYTSPKCQKIKHTITSKHPSIQPLIALTVAITGWLAYTILAQYFYPIYYSSQQSLLEIAKTQILIQATIVVFICLAVSTFHLTLKIITQILDKNHVQTAISRVAYSTYAVYLFHRPFLITFNYIMLEIFNIDMLQKANFPLTILALPILFILAYIIQKTADKATSKWLSK